MAFFMSRTSLSTLHGLVGILCVFMSGQTPVAKNENAKPDLSKEGVVIEQLSTSIDFNTDGTSKREQRTRVRVQSDAGVQQYGVLSFPYQASVEQLEIDYVRVQKPDGSTINTPPDFVQDMPSEVSRAAPFYSDLREKHIAVKRLAAGDILEIGATWRGDKPLAPGNFWLSWNFTKTAVVLDESLKIGVPPGREVKIKSPSVQPTVLEEGNRRTYTWKTSHLESQSKIAVKHDESYETARGLLPAPGVLISSFRSWDEVGRWYDSLQKDRAQASPEVRAKAAELTKSATDKDGKLKALYDYVSLSYRYIGIAFGIGRYQPHSAADILDNQYGDCKDKHTLLAALLSAAGIQAYPALINTSRVIDPDVPSPSQFDHVITVVPKGSELSWMDTTSEIAPLGFLLPQLREKPALVILPEKSEFRTTPANSPLANAEKYFSSGKLSGDGVLDTDARSEVRGDGEVMLRLAFRRVPQAQWKDLVQTISNGEGFAGTVSEVEASPPDKTETPFKFTYHYNRPNYSDWDHHQILASLPPFGLPAVQDEDLNRQKPLWISYPGEWQYESRIELPKGFTASLPQAVKLKEEFAEYESSTVMEGTVMVTKRHLVIKNREVTPSQLKSYKTFQKAISEEHFSYIQLSTGTSQSSTVRSGAAAPGPEFWRRAFTELPNSPNAEAAQAETSWRESVRNGDYSAGIADLKRAVAADPTFARGWIELGFSYFGTGEKKSALEAFQKAVAAEPKLPIPYEILANAYVYAGDQSSAIATWQRLQAVAPDNPEIAPNLGELYLAQKRYKEAIENLELAAKTDPSNAVGQFSLGTALLRSGEKDRGIATLHKALELESGTEMLNDVAYEMADENTNLTESLELSQRSIKEVEEKTQKLDLEDLNWKDLRLPMQLGAYWDTLGWIYYRSGDLSKAEDYLNAAFHLRPDGLVGDHLGQVYEKEKKLAEAVHMYSLALEVNPKMEETSERMRKLAHVRLPSNRMSAEEELSRMRTVTLPRIIKGTASADFYVLLAPGGKLKGSSFIHGSELLRFADDNLAKTVFKVPFPAGSSAYLLRKGILSCSSYTGCTFVFYPLEVAASLNSGRQSSSE